MSSLILAQLIGEGLESFEDAAAAPVTADAGAEVPAVPSVDVTVCEEEIAVVEAAGEAATAETAIVLSADAVVEAECLVDAQTEVVVQTAQVTASMESYVGSAMTKHDALALQMRVQQATKGQYAATQVVGSLEAFGTDITTDDALEAGLEGLGEFLKEARNKLSGMVAVLRAKMAGFFKDAHVSFDKVSARAAAVERLAKNTSGESNASALQLPLDTAWHLVKDGKVVTNFAKEMGDLAKFAELVLKENNSSVSEHRRKFIELVSPLISCDLEEANKLAKQIADWKLPKPDYAKTKIPTSSRTTDLYRSDVLLGDEALFVMLPTDVSSNTDNVAQRLAALSSVYFGLEVGLKDVAKRPNKLDVSIDTLKPAEIVKIAETITAVLGDIKVYAKTWGAWDEANSDLDRLMTVLATVQWEGDAENYEGAVSNGASTTVYVSTLNTRVADAIWYINAAYGYMATTPTILLAKKLIVLMNRALEVCERSLATYSDNNLK